MQDLLSILPSGRRQSADSVRDVEILWTLRANPVENPTSQIFLSSNHWCIAVLAPVDAAFAPRFA